MTELLFQIKIINVLKTIVMTIQLYYYIWAGNNAGNTQGVSDMKDIVFEFGKVLIDEMGERDFIERINKIHGPSEYSELVTDVVTLLINFVGPQHFVTGLALMEPCNVQVTDEIREIKGEL